MIFAMNNFEKACFALTEYITNNPDYKRKEVSRQKVLELVSDRYPEIKLDGSNMSPTDICYNRCNGNQMTKDFQNWPHALEYVEKGVFRILGSNVQYTGNVIWNKEKRNLFVFGEWYNGKFRRFLDEEIITCTDYEKLTDKVVNEIDELLNKSLLQGSDREAIVKVRSNQGEFRKRLLRRYSGCILCGIKSQNILIASHIKPWSDCEPNEKLDVDNGFLLCPNHDKLFDSGLITFDDDGHIIISDSINVRDQVLLNIQKNQSISLSEGNIKYLRYHRQNVFQEEMD